MNNNPNNPNNPNQDKTMTEVTTKTITLPNGNSHTLNIQYNWNKVVAHDDMQPNTVYLDGAVQAPKIDNERFSYSFDHHAGCVRSFTKATCEQVRDAIELGFPVHKIENIVINDVDADTVLSVWHLLNPTRCNEPKVVSMTSRIGWVDNNFTNTRAPHPIHFAINGKKWLPENNSVHSLENKLTIVNQYLDGDFEEVDMSRPPVRVIGIDSATKSVILDSPVDFSEAYLTCDIVIGCVPSKNGTIGYVIGKKSEFVPVNLANVYRAAQAIEPKGTSEKVWNGGSTIGGAVFYDDGSRSSLTPEQVLDIVWNEVV